MTGRIHLELVRWVGDIRDDPLHRARVALDSVLGQLAQDLLTDPETQARAEALKERLLDHPAVATSFISLWDALRRALTASLKDSEGAVRERMLTEVCLFAERLVAEATRRSLRAQIADSPQAARAAVARERIEAADLPEHIADLFVGDRLVRKERPVPGDKYIEVHRAAQGSEGCCKVRV